MFPQVDLCYSQGELLSLLGLCPSLTYLVDRSGSSILIADPQARAIQPREAQISRPFARGLLVASTWRKGDCSE